jgi:hypothetical protein
LTAPAGDRIIGAPGAGNYAGAGYVAFGSGAGFDASLDLTTLDGSNGFRIDGNRLERLVPSQEAGPV